MAISGGAFAIFPMYDTPTFKTKALYLVSNEGRVKRLLLLYKQIIQPYTSLLWLLLATHFIASGTPMDDIDSKSHKMQLKIKVATIIQPII